MNFLLVGFGGIGCRHLQSLLDRFTEANFFVMEPSDDVFNKNCNLINVDKNRLNRIKKFNEIDKLNAIDACIVATDSRPRYDIMSELIHKKIDHFLIEKVAFQNIHQFDRIIKLSNENRKQVFINFVRRYYILYNEIKKEINNSLISMEVMGGKFGLGCNGLHFIDLFKFLADEDLELSSYDLIEDNSGNKRGGEYREVLGSIKIVSNRGDNFKIHSLSDEKIPLVVKINFGENSYIINESKHTFSKKINNTLKKESDFSIQYTGELTSIIFQDIFNGCCMLPTIDGSKEIHSMFFEAVNTTLQLNPNEICPIT